MGKRKQDHAGTPLDLSSSTELLSLVEESDQNHKAIRKKIKSTDLSDSVEEQSKVSRKAQKEKKIAASPDSVEDQSKAVRKDRKKKKSSDASDSIEDQSKVSRKARKEKKIAASPESDEDQSKAVRKDRKKKKSSDASDSIEDQSKAAKRARKEKRRLKKLQNSDQSTECVTTAAEYNLAQDKSNYDNPKFKNAEKVKNHILNPSKLNGNGCTQIREEDCGYQSVTKPLPECGYSENMYNQNVDLTALSQATIDEFLTHNFISITDPVSHSPSLRPIIDFSYLPISDPLQLSYFEGFKAPTPIQAATWPFLFSGRDVIGVAETGSGKTIAFAVPCIRKIQSIALAGQKNGARAVILSPTRELAMQSYEQIMQLSKFLGINVVCVYGGVPKDEQRKALKEASIIVATPGRLIDLIDEGSADLSKVKFFVLDEADRMLDTGFEQEINKIINTTPEAGLRQTLMFTATWPDSVQALASKYMMTPVKIFIGDNKSGDLRANNRIIQKVEVVEPRDKESLLLKILKEYQSGSKKDERIIVFALYKKEATRIEGFIRSKGFRVASIHGDLSQDQRTRSLEAFKSAKTPILVATDVAARGLDIPSVKLVLNLTFPLTVEDYVHRIGRTGRAGKPGLAITFFTEHDKAQSGSLINVLKAAKQEVPEALLKFGTTVKKKQHDAYGAFTKEVDMTRKAKKIRFD